MKYAKINPMNVTGFPRKGYEDCFFFEHNHEAMAAIDLALAKRGLEIQEFPNAPINGTVFRIVERK